MMRAPSVMRSKSRPVSIITTNTAERVSGTASATTMPTREAQRHETHEDHHAQRGEELHHELVDRVVDNLGLVGDFREGDAQRRLVVDRHLFGVQRLAEGEPVETGLHHEAEHQGLLAVVADLEGLRVFVAALHLRDVAELEAAVAGRHRQVADGVEVVDGAVEPQVHARTIGLDEAGGVTSFWLAKAARSC